MTVGPVPVGDSIGAIAAHGGLGAGITGRQGAAATGRRDTIPAGLPEAGGSMERFGVPVDPGNLLLLGRLAGKPVLGAPSTLPVTATDLRRYGVGELLIEIVARPQPRSGGAPDETSR